MALESTAQLVDTLVMALQQAADAPDRRCELGSIALHLDDPVDGSVASDGGQAPMLPWPPAERTNRRSVIFEDSRTLTFTVEGKKSKKAMEHFF